LGGTWLSGAAAPTVSTRPGVALSLDVHRTTGSRISGGGAARVQAQPLQLREHDIEWDGGTLTDAQLLGTLAVALHRGSSLQSALEFGGGLTFLSGARTLYPFSQAGRVTVASEGGISLQRSDARHTRAMAIVLRYAVVRLDPGPTSVTNPEAMSGTVGWVGRSTLGLRIQR
jgi:hypothetical protein